MSHPNRNRQWNGRSNGPGRQGGQGRPQGRGGHGGGGHGGGGHGGGGHGGGGHGGRQGGHGRNNGHGRPFGKRHGGPHRHQPHRVHNGNADGNVLHQAAVNIPAPLNGDRKRIVLDVDETLGMPLVDGRHVTGYQLRTGARELLEDLSRKHELILWSSSNRQYLVKLLKFGLAKYFRRTVTYDEVPAPWKDIRKVGADFLVDFSDHHKHVAEQQGIAKGYIVVPAYGSVEDEQDPLEWTRIVRAGIQPAPAAQA